MRLDPRFRYAVYAAFAVLFGTGSGWLLADRMKEESFGASEAWQTAAANLIMVHGGTAMVTLLLLGALLPLHMQRAWRRGRNRLTAIVMLATNGLLIVTSFGLYYAGSELLRPWTSNIHITLGLCLPVLFFVHVLIGRLRS